MADSRRVINVFGDEREDIYPPAEGWISHVRRVAPGRTLGMSVIELLPGQTSARITSITATRSSSWSCAERRRSGRPRASSR
jgi:hypothetical protein